MAHPLVSATKKHIFLKGLIVAIDPTVVEFKRPEELVIRNSKNSYEVKEQENGECPDSDK